MSFLFAILQRYAHVVLFVLCELIAFVLIINFNQKQKDIFLHSSSKFSGSILKKSAQLNDYLSLQKSNDDLLKENARLLKEIISMPRNTVPETDSSMFDFDVIPAQIINNSISSLRNHFTIDKGSKDGISPSMGVITTDGVIGIVKSVNENYASVLSLLNIDTRISASINEENFFGTITWDGKSYNYLNLSEIPTHTPLNNGDKVVTNGYSTIFPSGLTIGNVTSFGLSKNGAFYDISVKPSADFTSLGHVYALKANLASEIISLEKDE